MMNWGRVALGTVLQFMFTTYDGATGASEEGSGLAVTDIEIYKAGGGLTQRSSDAGYSLLDADGHALDTIVGLAGFTIDTGDNTDAGFFVAGGYYIVVVASVTVDAQTVNFIAGTFSLGPTLTVAGVEEVDVTHWLGTAAATPTVAGVPEVDLTHVGGTAVTAAAGIPEVKVASIAANAITATAINADAITAAKVAADVSAEIADAVWDEDATAHQTQGTFGQAIGDPAADTNTIFKAVVTDASGATVGADSTEILADTADMQPKLGTPAGVSISADVAAVEAQTDDIGAAGAGLTAVPWNAAWDAEVQSEVEDALDVTLADSVPADGTRPTLRQAAYMIAQFLMERSVSSTTVTVNKVDGTTALMTLTLNDATSPTSITRAT